MYSAEVAMYLLQADYFLTFVVLLYGIAHCCHFFSVESVVFDGEVLGKIWPTAPDMCAGST